MQDAVTTIAVNNAAGSSGAERWRAVARNIFPFVVVGTIWEIVALAGVFPHRLFHRCPSICCNPAWTGS